MNFEHNIIYFAYWNIN